MSMANWLNFVAYIVNGLKSKIASDGKELLRRPRLYWSCSAIKEEEEERCLSSFCATTMLNYIINLVTQLKTDVFLFFIYLTKNYFGIVRRVGVRLNSCL